MVTKYFVSVAAVAVEAGGLGAGVVVVGDMLLPSKQRTLASDPQQAAPTPPSSKSCATVLVPEPAV